MSDEPKSFGLWNSLPPKGWIRPVGRKDRPKIAIVGEFPTLDDTRLCMPFTGKNGDMVTLLLRRLGVSRSDCYITTVFLENPSLDNPEIWTLPVTELKALGHSKPKLPPMIRNRYLVPEQEKALARLKLELQLVKPNIVIALGPIASWALLEERGIAKKRGTISLSTLVEGQKVLTTYSPAQVQKQFELYPIILADFTKAVRASDTPDFIVPERFIWINPQLSDMERYYENHIQKEAGSIGVDIETQGGQITCIGFASSKTSCLVVPLWVKDNKENPHYWPTLEAEVLAMEFCKKILQHPRPKVFQNGVYDMSYLWRVWGMPLKNCAHDTMLLHHSLQPEMKKGLGFLASCYTDEPEWKSIRRKAMDTEKREE